MNRKSWVHSSRLFIQPYAIAGLAVAIALVTKLLLMPLTGTESPFLLFFAAIILSATYSGIRAGIAAIILSAVISYYLFLSSEPSVLNPTLGQNLHLLLFIIEGGLIISIIARLQTANQQVRQGQEQVQLNRELQEQIRERQRIESELQESERRFRAIFNRTFQFIGLMQPDGTLIEANQTALDFGGLQPQDVLNRPFWEARWWTLSPEIQEQLRTAIAQAATGEFIRYEVDVRGAGEAIATIDFSIKPVYDDNGQVVLLLPEGRNISDLRQVEKTLRSFFDSASMMMGIVELVDDTDIRHIADNATTLQFFGRTANPMQGHLASELGVPQSHIQEWIRHYQRSVQTQAPVKFEYPHITPDGEYWLAATVCAIPVPSGQIPRFSYIVEDVTNRKQIENQIRQLNAELEQRVSARTAELATANQKLAAEVAERERALQELRETEAAFRQSEQKFRLVAESMPQIVWTTDSEGAVDYYNQRWTEYSGITREAGHNWGWQPILHPDDEQRTIEAWQQAVSSQQFYECEHRLRRADGEFCWFLSRGLPLFDEHGQLIKWFGTATDIHHQKVVQEELRESQERFQQLAETIKDVFWLTDSKTYQILYVNPAYEQLWGRSRDQLYAHPEDWLVAIHPDDRPLVQTVFYEQVTQGGYDLTFRIVHPDGGIRWVRDRGFPVYDATGKPYRIAGLAEDITDRKHTELELQIRVQQQAAIAHLGQKALAASNLDFIIEIVVHVIVQTLDVPYCKILELLPGGKQFQLRWGIGWQPELLGVAMVEANVNSQAGYTLMSQEPVIVTDLRQETRFTSSDLLHQSNIISGMSVQIAGSAQPFGVLSVHTTEPRLFTQDDVYFLQAAANILAETIQRQQAREILQRQSAELALANRLKDEFLATISHELRTPLNSMLGWTKLLPTRQFSPEITERALDTIARNTESLAHLVEDVLDMSDIITGRFQLKVAPVLLELILEQAIASIQLAAQAKNIQIKSSTDTSVGMILGDATRLQQVFWNLLSNAVKFTPNDGRVEVRLDRVDRDKPPFPEKIQGAGTPMLPDTLSATPYARIAVTDTGKGIAPAFLSYVFDRFRQEDGSTTRLHGGLGLGLAIVRYLVEQHGGSVHADSEGEGRGATFTVYLPLFPETH